MVAALTDARRPEDFPASAFFPRDEPVAAHWGRVYGEGYIETWLPRDVFDQHLAQHERPYPGWQGMTEIEVPSNLLDLISSYPRTAHRLGFLPSDRGTDRLGCRHAT
jgi:hypothetical protein